MRGAALLLVISGLVAAAGCGGDGIVSPSEPALALVSESAHYAYHYEAGEAALPLDRIIETTGFRALADSVLSYREAGSFVRFLIDRWGLDRFLAFYRSGVLRDDRKDAIQRRFQAAIGVSFEEAEAACLEMLRAGS